MKFDDLDTFDEDNSPQLDPSKMSIAAGKDKSKQTSVHQPDIDKLYKNKEE
jgi:hypothetical protein